MEVIIIINLLYKMNGLNVFLFIHCLIALGTTLPPLVSDQPLLHTGPGWHCLHPLGRRESVGIRMPVQIPVVHLAFLESLGMGYSVPLGCSFLICQSKHALWINEGTV